VSASSPAQLVIVILFACFVNWPCILWGLQFGHDHNLHVTYLHFFEAQLRTGELYPRWISGLNFGAGSPIFFVQYPLPYYAASALHLAFHLPATPVGEAHALGLFVFLSGVIAGVSSWLWCRSLTNSVIATLASVAYLTMPYVYGCDVYYRGAIGEYSALAWAPLALYFVHRLQSKPGRALAGIAISVAAVTLSNLFTVILFAPLLLLYVLGVGPQSRILRPLALASAGMFLGFGLSAVYLLPMNAHRTFFHLTNLLKLGPNIYYYRDNLFPFGTSLFPTGHLSLRAIDLFAEVFALVVVGLLAARWKDVKTSRIAAGAAILCLLVTCAAPWLHWLGYAPHAELAIPRVIDVRSRIFLISFLTLEAALLSFAMLRNQAQRLPRLLFTSCLACYFLSTRWSEWLWQHAAALWNIQFPWRLGGMLSLFGLGLIAVALGEVWKSAWRYRKAILFASAGLWLLIVVATWIALDLRGNLTPPFVTEIKHRIESPYPAYASVTAMPMPEELGPNDGMERGVVFLAGGGTAGVDAITPRHVRLRANCVDSCTLLLSLVYYPFWRAHERSGRMLDLQPSSRAGLTQVSLSPGAHEIDMQLPYERSEIWGAWLSAFSLLTLASICLFDRARNRRYGQPSRNRIESTLSVDGKNALNSSKINALSPPAR